MATIPRVIGAVCWILLTLLPVRAEIRTIGEMKAEQPSEVVQLPDLGNPTGIHVDGGRIFITEESSVAIYSAADLQL